MLRPFFGIGFLSAQYPCAEQFCEWLLLSGVAKEIVYHERINVANALVQMSAVLRCVLPSLCLQYSAALGVYLARVTYLLWDVSRHVANWELGRIWQILFKQPAFFCDRPNEFFPRRITIMPTRASRRNGTWASLISVAIESRGANGDGLISYWPGNNSTKDVTAVHILVWD